LTKSRILLIEGKRTDHASFAAGLTKKGYLVESVPSGTAALAHLETSKPDLVVIDASSMRSNGKRICQALHQQIADLPLILVLDKDADRNDNYNADELLILPFTMQKLVNRVKRLLPIETNGGLRVGPIMLDVEQLRAIIREKQVQLTPRLVILLKLLMERAGEVINREEMFRIAWETDYTGDTRSLDVHMSWLRQAIEENVRHPEFIKTVRGVGYRLDLDASSTQPQNRKKQAK
jgi:DNA-binding response OmpR family regulator